MADVATNDASLWDKTKQIVPIALETGLNTAMVVPGAVAARRGALYTVGRYGSGAMQNSARAVLVSDLNGYPFYAISSGSGNGVRLNNSIILGHSNTTPSGSEYFMPSHFAPASLREVYELIDRLGKSDQPVVFAITDDLQKMLQKTGSWYYTGSVPQPFDGQIVMKKLMVNRAFKPEIIEEIAKEYHLNPEVFKKQLLESRGIQQELSPTMTPLSELLTEDDLLKLKNSIK